MKINYKYGKLKLTIWIPTSLVKNKKIQKLLHIEEYNEFINVALIECRKYVKKNGHFTLIDLNTIDEGKKINIKIKI